VALSEYFGLLNPFLRRRPFTGRLNLLVRLAQSLQASQLVLAWTFLT